MIPEPGPHLPFPEKQLLQSWIYSVCICILITDDMLEHLVDAINFLCQEQEGIQKKYVPTIEYLGILLLMSIKSDRSYQQAWNQKRSQFPV